MPGFLGGSSGGSSGTGGEISFPKEFIDPVTKLRVSQPENLIDTDFEYGLQPTKWETVELINNTPSFFSKSGDTTIPNIISITTNAGTREITVVTALEHGVSVGIPIQVTGTKSVTADGSYIINSIPNTTTFTYLCKANQLTTASIEDLYSSIITGEFFQGSQLRVADASGIVTNNAEGNSTLTIKTESAHGFKTNTPFYFLNLNSTISKDFQASNTAAKSFDSTNEATAQTFDGSNTLSSINIDWSNSATVGGVVSTISGASTLNNTLTVTHSTENFVGQPLGTPLYYAVTGGSGYFATNPRGVIFLKSISNLGSGTSTFQVSATPDGDVIAITAQPSGTFQLANQARTFAGNNVNPLTQTQLTIIKESNFDFDGGNRGYPGSISTNGLCTVEGYAGTILVSTTAGAGLDYYVGAMVRYDTTGTAASGLTNGQTYFIASFASTATPNQFRITIKELPTSASALAPTGGSGDQTFTKIGVSLTKDIVHVRNANFTKSDMVEYTFPAGTGGRFAASGTGEKQFYFIETAYDEHNYVLAENAYTPTVATGGTTTEVVENGRTWKVHTFSTVGTTSFTVSTVGSENYFEYLVVAGGGGGSQGLYHGGGGGAGGFLEGTLTNLTATSYTVTVGAGGLGGTNGQNGGNSVFGAVTATGGGAGGPGDGAGINGGSGGGAGVRFLTVGTGIAGQGNNGGPGKMAPEGPNYGAGGGGGAGSTGFGGYNYYGGAGGAGKRSSISGTFRYYAAGGGGSVYAGTTSGYGANGIGGRGTDGTGAGNAVANTGSGGGGKDGRGAENIGSGNGGSGIVIVRYPITERTTSPIPMVASGGSSTSDIIVGSGVNAVTYRVHQFRNVGTSNFTISNVGNITDGVVEYLVVGGGGGGASWVGGGGGGGGFLDGSIKLANGTYSITVGAGGRLYENGGNSSIGSLVTALGGGHGGGWDSARLTVYSTGSAGASSGGAGAVGDNIGGTNRTRVYPSQSSAYGQGYRGGTGVRFTTDNSNSHITGGGGGAGGQGSDGEEVNSSSSPRPNGGPGLPSSILGTEYYFAGGGGGSCITAINSGNGGIGGGGGGHSWAASPGAGGGSALNSGTAGSQGTTTRIAGNGGANTGGGGGGAYSSDSLLIGNTDRGGIGGSGIVVIRYPITVKGAQ